MNNYYNDDTLGQEELEKAASSEELTNTIHQGQRNLKKQSINPYQQIADKEYQAELNLQKQKALIDENYRYGQEQAQINRQNDLYKIEEEYYQRKNANIADSYNKYGQTFLPDDIHQAMVRKGVDLSNDTAILTNYKNQKDISSALIKSNIDYNTQIEKLNANYNHQLNKLGIQREFMNKQFDKIKSDLEFQNSIAEGASKELGEFLNSLYSLGVTPFDVPNESYTNSMWQNLLQSLVGVIDEFISGIGNIATGMQAGELTPLREITNFLGITNTLDYKDGFSSKYDVGFKSYIFNPTRLMDLGAGAIGSTIGFLGTGFGVGGAAKLTLKGISLASFGNKVKATFNKMDNLIHKAKVTGDTASLSGLIAQKILFSTIMSRVTANMALQTPIIAAGRVAGIAEDRAKLNNRTYEKEQITARDWMLGTTSALMDTMSIPLAFGGGKLSRELAQNILNAGTKGGKLKQIAKASVVIPATTTANLTITEGLTEVVSTISEIAGVYGFDLSDILEKYNSGSPEDAWLKEAVNSSFFAGIVGGSPLSIAGSTTSVVSNIKESIDERKAKRNAPINTELGRINQYETSIAAFNGKVDNTLKDNPELSKSLKDKYRQFKAMSKLAYSNPEKNTGLDFAEKQIDEMTKDKELNQVQKDRIDKIKNKLNSSKRSLEATNITLDNIIDKTSNNMEKVSSIIDIANSSIINNQANPENIFKEFVEKASEIDGNIVKETLKALSHENEFEIIPQESKVKEPEKDNTLEEYKDEASQSQKQLEADNSEYELNKDKAETKHQSFISKVISNSKSIGENAVNKATTYSSFLSKKPNSSNKKNTALEERENKRINNIIKVRNNISDLIYSSNEFKNPQVLSLIKDKITNSSNVEVLSNDIIEVVIANKMKEKEVSYNADDKLLEPFINEIFPDLKEYQNKKEIISYIKQLIRNRRTTTQIELPSITKDLKDMNKDVSFIQEQLTQLMENAKYNQLDKNKKIKDEISQKIKHFTNRLKAYNRLFIKLEESANTEQAKQEAYIAKTLLVQTANKIDDMASSLEIFMNNLNKINDNNFMEYAKSQLSADNENTQRFADLFDSLVDRFQRVFLSFLENFVNYFRVITQDMTQKQMFEMIENVQESFKGLHSPINKLRVVTQSIIKNNKLNTEFKNSVVIEDKSNTELSKKLGISAKAYANNMLYSAALENYIDFSIDLSNKNSIPNKLGEIIEGLINYKPYLSKDNNEAARETTIATLDTNKEAMLLFLLGSDSYKKLKTIKKYRLDANNSNNITKDEIINELMDNGRITYLQEFFKALSASFITSFNRDSSQTKEAYLADYKVYDNIGIGNQLLKSYAEYTGMNFNKNDLGDVVDIEGLNPDEFRNTLFSLVSSFLSSQNKEKTIYKDIATNEATIQKASSMMRWFDENYKFLDKEEILKLPAKEVMFMYMSRNNPNLVNSELSEEQRLKYLFGKVIPNTKLGNIEEELLEILASRDTIKLIDYLNKKISTNFDSRYRKKHFLLFSKDKDTGLEMLMDIENVRKEKIKEIEKNNSSNNVLSNPSKTEARTLNIAKNNQKLYGIDSSDLHILNRDLKVNQSVDESKMLSIEEYNQRIDLAMNNFNGLSVNRLFNDNGECNIFFYVPIYNIVKGKRMLEGYAPLRQIENYEEIFKNLGIEPLKNSEYMNGNDILKDSLPDMREFGEFYYLSKGTQEDFYYEWDEQGQGRTFIINSAFNFQSNKYIRPLVVLKKDYDGKDYVNKTDMRNIKIDMNDRNFKSIVMSLQIGDKKSNEIDVVANGDGFLFKHKGGNQYYQDLAKDIIIASKTGKISEKLQKFMNDYNSRGDVEVKETEDILEHMNVKKIFYWIENPTEFSANSLRMEIDGSATGVAESSLIMPTNRQDIQENMGLFRYFVTDLGLLYSSKNFIAKNKTFEGKENITLNDVLDILSKDVYGISVVELYKAGQSLKDMNSIRVRALMNLFNVPDNMTAKEASKLYKTLRNEIGKGLLTPTNYGSRASSVFTSQSPSSISRRLFDLMTPELNSEIDRIVKEENINNIGSVFDRLVIKSLRNEINNKALQYMLLEANNNPNFKSTIERSNSIQNNNLFDTLLRQVYFSEKEVETSEAIFNMIDFNVLSTTLNQQSKYKIDINNLSQNKILEYTQSINKIGKHIMPIIFEGIENNLRALNLNTLPILNTLKSLSYKSKPQNMKIGKTKLLKVNGQKVGLTDEFKSILNKLNIKISYEYNGETKYKSYKQILKELKSQISMPLNYYANLLKSSRVSIMNTNQIFQGISTRALSPFADTMNIRNAATTHYRDIFGQAISKTYFKGFKIFASYLSNPNALLQYISSIENEKKYPMKNKIEYVENYIAQNINRFTPKKEFDSAVLAYRKAMIDTNAKIDELHKTSFGQRYGLHFSLDKKTSSTKHKSTTSNFIVDNTSELNKENIILSSKIEQGKKQAYSKLANATDIQTIRSIMTDVVRLVEHDIEATVMNPVMATSGLAHGTIYDAMLVPIADSDEGSNMWNKGFEKAKQENPFLSLFNYLGELHSYLEEQVGEEIPIKETSNMLAFIAANVDYISKMNFNNIVTEGTDVNAGRQLKVGDKNIYVFGQTGGEITNSPMYKEYHRYIADYINKGYFRLAVRDNDNNLRQTQQGQSIMNNLLISERLSNANRLKDENKKLFEEGVNKNLLYLLPNVAINIGNINFNELDVNMNKLPENKQQFEFKEKISKVITNYDIKENQNKEQYNMNSYLKNNSGKILSIQFNDDGSFNQILNINNNNGNPNGFIEVIGNIPNNINEIIETNEFQNKIYSFIESISSNASINMTFNPVFEYMNNLKNIKSLILNYIPSESNLKTDVEQYLDDNKHTKTNQFKKDDRRLNRVNTNYEITWNKYPLDSFAQKLIDISNNRDIDEKTMDSMKDNNMINLWGILNTGVSGSIQVSPMTILEPQIFSDEMIKKLQDNGLLDEALNMFRHSLNQNPITTNGYYTSPYKFFEKRMYGNETDSQRKLRNKNMEQDEFDTIRIYMEEVDNNFIGEPKELEDLELVDIDTINDELSMSNENLIIENENSNLENINDFYNRVEDTSSIDDTTPDDDLKKKSNFKYQLDGNTNNEPDLNTILNSPNTIQIANKFARQEIDSFISSIENREIRDLISSLFDKLNEQITDNVEFYIANDTLMNGSRGFTTFRNGKIYVVVSKKNYQGSSNTLAHEFIHGALYQSTMIEHSLGVMEYTSNLRRIQHQIINIIENNEELMKNLGFLDEDNNPNNIFYAVKSSFEEFSAYFLTDVNKLNYISSITRKDVANKNVNSYIQKLFNLIKTALSKIISLISAGYYKHNPSILEDLKNNIEKLSQYNTPEKAYQLDNTTYNKIVRKLDSITRDVLLKTPIVNLITGRFESYEGYLKRKNISDAEVQSIMKDIRNEWKDALKEKGFKKLTKMLPVLLAKTPIHREIGLNIFNEVLRRHNNIFTREISGVLQSLKIISPNNLTELERIAGKTSALQQELNIYLNNQKEMLDEFFDNAISQEAKDMLKKLDEEWSKEEYKDDIENDLYRMNRFSPTERFNRSVSAIFETGLFSSSNSRWLRMNNQELYPYTIAMLLRGDLEDVNNSISEIKKEIKENIFDILKASKYRKGLDIKNMTNNFDNYIDTMTWELGYQRLAGGKSQKGLQNVSEILNRLGMYEDIQLIGDVSLKDLHSVLLQAISSDNVNRGNLRNLLSQIHYLTTLQSIKHIKDVDADYGSERANAAYHFNTQMYRDKIDTINDVIGDNEENIQNFINSMHSVGLILNSLSISSKLREAYIPDEYFQDIIHMELEQQKLLSNPTKENMEQYKALQNKIDGLEQKYDTTIHEFIQYDFTRDYSADTFIPYEMNDEIHIVEIDRINTNEKDNITEEDVKDYYQSITHNKFVNSYKEAIDFMLQQGYKIVDEYGIMKNKITDDDYKHRRLTLKYVGNEVNRDSLTKFTMLGQSFENKGNDLDRNLSYKNNQLDKIKAKSKEEQARSYASIFYDVNDKEHIQHIYDKLSYKNENFSFDTDDKKQVKKTKKSFVNIKNNPQDKQQIIYQFMETNEKYRAISGSNNLYRTQMNRFTFENLTDVDTDIRKSILELTKLTYRQKVTENLNKDLIKSIIKDNIKMRENGVNFDSDAYVKIYDSNYEQTGLSRAEKIEQKATLGMTPRMPENVIYQIGMLLRAYNEDIPKNKLTQLYIPRDIMNLIVGVETKTLGTYVGKFFQNPIVTKWLNWLGYRGSQMLNDTKSNIIIRNPSVLLKNFTSSCLSLTSIGMSIPQIASSVQSTINDIMNYQKDLGKLYNLLSQRDALKETTNSQDERSLILKQIDNEIASYSKRLEENPVYIPMQMGADTNIVNETIGDTSYATGLYRKAADKIWKAFDKRKIGQILENKYGLTIDKINEEVLMTTESEAYKGAVFINRFGDIAPRIIAYHHYKRQGYTDEKAFELSRTSFIDYITPLESSAMRFAERVGAFPFLRFAIRAIPAALQNIVSNPASTMISIASTSLLEAIMPNVVGLSIYGEFANIDNKLSNPFRTISNTKNWFRFGWLF